MGRDNATFRDKETEVPSLSRDNGTSSKSCHGTGRDETTRDRTRQDETGKEGTREGTISTFFSMILRLRTSFPVLKRPLPVLEIFSLKRFTFFLYFVPGWDRTGLVQSCWKP